VGFSHSIQRHSESTAGSFNLQLTVYLLHYIPLQSTLRHLRPNKMYTHALLTQTSWQHCNSIGFAGTSFTFRWLNRGRRSFVPSSEMSARRRTAAGGDDTQISAEIRAPAAVACGPTATATGDPELYDLSHHEGASAGSEAAASGAGDFTSGVIPHDGELDIGHAASSDGHASLYDVPQDNGDASGVATSGLGALTAGEIPAEASVAGSDDSDGEEYAWIDQ
jgi:hypothetical protein